MYKFCANCGGDHWETSHYALPTCPSVRRHCNRCNGIWHTSATCDRFHRIRTTGIAEPFEGFVASSSRSIVPHPSNEPRFKDENYGYTSMNINRFSPSFPQPPQAPTYTFQGDLITDAWYDHCLRRFASESDLALHVRESHDKKIKREPMFDFQSTKGTDSYRPAAKVQRSAKSYASAAQRTQRKFQCHACRFVNYFATEAALAQHTQDAHHKQLSEVATKARNGINFRCPIPECGSGFSKVDDLKQHLATCSFINSGDDSPSKSGQQPTALTRAVHPSNTVDTQAIPRTVGTLRERNQREQASLRSIPAAMFKPLSDVKIPSKKGRPLCKWCRDQSVPSQYHFKYECPRAGPPCPECNWLRNEHRSQCPLGGNQGASIAGSSVTTNQDNLKRKRRVDERLPPAPSASPRPRVRPDLRRLVTESFDLGLSMSATKPLPSPPPRSQFQNLPLRPQHPPRPNLQHKYPERYRVPLKSPTPEHRRLPSHSPQTERRSPPVNASQIERRPLPTDSEERRAAWNSLFGQVIRENYVDRGDEVPDILWEDFLNMY